jgi:hypothetical protein
VAWVDRQNRLHGVHPAFVPQQGTIHSPCLRV